MDEQHAPQPQLAVAEITTNVSAHDSQPTKVDLPQEELIHVNNGDEILVDEREPKVSNIHIIPVIGLEWIWVGIGSIFALLMGCVPPTFFLLLGTLFSTLATASADTLLYVKHFTTF
jgi:hypothetical protein